MSKKRGKLSTEEENFIRDNAAKLTIADIADKLNRTTEPINRFITEKGIASIDKIDNLDEEYESLLVSLKKKTYWKELHHQLDPDELNYFASFWIDMMIQFGQDVLTSEEYQIKQLVLLEILTNRLMRKRLLAKKDIERLGKALEDEYAQPAASRNNDDIASMEAQLALAKVADSNLTNEQNKLAQDIKTLYKDLKATRDQRFSKIESGEKTFTTLIKSLYDEEVRQKEGEAALLMQRATDQQNVEMTEYHKYGDGILDLPFLTPEAILKKKEEDRHAQEEKLIEDKQEQEREEHRSVI